MLEGHLKEFASEEELSQECARILDGSSPLFKQPEFSAFPGAKRQIQEWIFYKIREIRTDDPAPLRVLSEATASFVSRLVTADDMNSRLSSQAVSTLYHLTGRCASAQDQLARLLENNLDSRHLPSLVGCSPSVVSSTLSPRLQSVLWLVIDSQRPAEARSAAAGVLASHSGEDPELRARLIRGYWERDESSRSAIVEGLRNSYRPAQPILDFATQVLRTERSESARGHAIEILTGSREGVDRQTVTLVRASLTDPSSFVRMSAVMFFAHQGGREDVGPLESMAGSDSDAEVRRRAKEAVAVLRKKHP